MKTRKPPHPRTPALARRESLGRSPRTAALPVLDLAPARPLFRHLLVPVDFSEHSRQALLYARRLAEQFDASLTLLHVIEPIVLPGDLAYVPVESGEIDERRMAEARTQLQRVANELGAAVPVQTVVRLGRAWREITETARRRNIDLLILATHGYTGLKYALLGSVAEKIIRHSPCPALVVRTEGHEPL